MEKLSVQKTYTPCSSIYYDWIYISKKGPINEFKFNIPMDVYLTIQNLSYPDLLEIFPGLKIFNELLNGTGIKGFGKINRKVKERDDKVTSIKLQRIRIKAKTICLDGIVFKFDHELYNILPTFLIPYKRYIAEHIFKCASHNRSHVINNSEEFPSTRQTYRWAKHPSREDFYNEKKGSIVVFNMDEKAYNTIIAREMFRKCKKTKRTEEN